MRNIVRRATVGWRRGVSVIAKHVRRHRNSPKSVQHHRNSRRLPNVEKWWMASLLSSWLILVSFQGGQAFACIMPSLERTPFFDDIPANFDEPVIVEITVIGLLESSWDLNWRHPPNERRSFNVLAHVDRVLKGAIDTETIKVVAPPSSCDRPFALGQSGIVMGAPLLRENRIVELRVVSQSIDERLRRRERRQPQ